jgi:DNA polymerase type B, organellar and viral
MSYTSGACDMYIPCSPLETDIYAYDVNSLYPYIMKQCDMPIGNPNLFKGDIRAIDSNTFGFFYCNIIAPDNLNEPIIQTHVKTNNGLRTIAPLGQ